MRKMLPLLMAGLLVLPAVTSLSGCAMGNTSIAHENEDTLSKKLVRGKTRKTEVLYQFGEPSERTYKDGREVWTYRMTDTKFRTYVPFAGIVMGNNGTMTTDLIVTFDKAGVVAGYEVAQFRG